MAKQARSAQQRLHDILDAIESIERYAAGKDLPAYRRDVMLRDAVERNLERLSEATRHLSPSLKRLRPETPWRDIADFGNVLRHAYDRVDVRIVWDTLEKDLPLLKLAVQALITHVEKNS